MIKWVQACRRNIRVRFLVVCRDEPWRWTAALARAHREIVLKGVNPCCRNIRVGHQIELAIEGSGHCLALAGAPGTFVASVWTRTAALGSTCPSPCRPKPFGREGSGERPSARPCATK